jgi:Calx-beta domain
VNFSTANGTAQSQGNGNSADYTAATGSCYFYAGQTSQTIGVVIRGDRKKESNETFLVNLSSPTNATIADGQAQGTIMNDD